MSTQTPAQSTEARPPGTRGLRRLARPTEQGRRPTDGKGKGSGNLGAAPVVVPDTPEFFGELTWRTLIRPNRSARPGTMAAGLILLTMVVALLGALVVNAQVIERESRSKNDGTWRHAIAAFFAEVTSPLRGIRDRIDTALGKQVPKDDVPREGEVTFLESDPAETTRAAAMPKMRTPTPEEPLRLWVGGDSIVGIFGTELLKASSATGIIKGRLDYKPSTGLSRPDYFNWPDHIREVAKDEDPEVIVIMFGANDIQGMRVGGGAVQPLTPEWLEEYRKRVGEIMDIMRDEKQGDRLVLWVGALPMGPNSGVKGMEQVNYIYWSEAQKRPWVRFVDAWPFFVGPNGAYEPRLPSADGTQHLLRERDNIHLTAAGGDRLAWAVLDALGQVVDLSNSQTSPPAEQRAPDSVKERPEVPKPPDWPLTD
ncbi:MAG: hypothetical protein N2037_08595 [Acidimicrobiales bacterium]|nr:hypothetical protein [Acidimicrobiales bacterium]